MPLISNANPTGEIERSTTIQVKDHESAKREKDLGFDDFGELGDEFVDSEMESSIIPRPQLTMTQMPPALPLRSEKRVSRLLENVMVELKSWDGSIPATQVKEKLEISDPLERYLSSEEDTSFSDDYSDTESLIDFSPIESPQAQNAPSSRGSSRKSQEDTARVVSFTAVGKPQLIEIILNPSQKRQSISFDSEADLTSLPRARRPSPLKLYPSALHRLSISSTKSFTSTSYISTIHPNDSSPSLTTLPPRKSSKIASNFSSLVTSRRHAFLSSDPFPAAEANELVMPVGVESSPTPPTPKTPISMAASAWKHGITRTLSKARKPSMPKLSHAYTSDIVPAQQKGLMRMANTSVEDLSKQLDELDPWKQRQRAATTPRTPHDGTLRHDDSMKNVVKVPSPPPYSPTRERKLSLGLRGLARRKSIRGKDRYLG